MTLSGPTTKLVMILAVKRASDCGLRNAKAKVEAWLEGDDFLPEENAAAFRGWCLGELGKSEAMFTREPFDRVMSRVDMDSFPRVRVKKGVFAEVKGWLIVEDIVALPVFGRFVLFRSGKWGYEKL